MTLELDLMAGLIGRAPAEPEALDELLEGGRDARVVGEDEVGGERTDARRLHRSVDTGVYELANFGDPVSGLEFETQAG